MPSSTRALHDKEAGTAQLGTAPLWLAVALAAAGLTLGLAVLAQRLAAESAPQLATPTEPTVSRRPAQELRLQVGGSGSCIALMRRIVATCKLQGQGPNVVVHEGIGSGGGLAALADGVLDVALVSRPLKPAERKGDLHTVPYARSPVALALQPELAVGELSRTQVSDLLAGKTEHWPDGSPAHWLLREHGDSSHEVLRAGWPGFVQWEQAARQSAQVQVLFHDRTMHATLQFTPGAFGWVDAAAVRAEGVPVQLPKIDGTAPDSSALAEGRWPWWKEQAAVVNARSRTKAAPLLDCLRSPAAREAMFAAGALPLP